MKKYFAAGVVAVMVFAFAAFAASLEVDGGVLQAGADDDLTCTGEVEVLSYRIQNNNNGVGSLGVRLGEDNGFAGCEDVDVFVQAYDDDALIARAFGNTGDVGTSGLILDWQSFGQGPLVDPANIESVQVILESSR